MATRCHETFSEELDDQVNTKRSLSNANIASHETQLKARAHDEHESSEHVPCTEKLAGQDTYFITKEGQKECQITCQKLCQTAGVLELKSHNWHGFCDAFRTLLMFAWYWQWCGTKIHSSCTAS